MGLALWRRWILLAAFFATVALAGHYSLLTMRHASEWRSHREGPVCAWMTVPYVARNYKVSPDSLYQALDLAPRARDRRTLRSIARLQKRPVQQVMGVVEKTIASHRQDGGEAEP